MAIVAEQLTPRNRTADANYETLVSSCNYEASITINIRNYAQWPALVITLPKLPVQESEEIKLFTQVIRKTPSSEIL